MTQNLVDEHIESLLQCQDKLLQLTWQCTDPRSSPTDQLCLQPVAVEELASTVKKLQVATEELRQYNSKLAASCAALEAERQHYQELFEFAPNAYLVTDAKGVIQEANRAATNLLHLPLNLLVGKPLVVVVAPRDEHAFYTLLNQLQEGLEVGEWEAEIHLRGGTNFPAAFTVAPVENAKGKVIALRWLLQDITHRVQAEEEKTRLIASLQESELRYRNLFNGANDAVLVYHLTPEGKADKLLEVNDVACQRLGYTREELLQKYVYDLVDRSTVNVPVRVEKVDSDLHVIVESVQVSKEGTKIPVEVSSHLFYMKGKRTVLSIWRDITERKQAESELRKSLKELSDIKLALDEAAILAVSDQTGIIHYVNDKFCQLSQYSREELIGETHRLLKSGYHPTEFFGELWSTISKGKVWKGEIKNKAKDGSYYWVDTTIVPFLDESGNPFQYLQVQFDITERKQATESLRAALQKLTFHVENSPLAFLEWDCDFRLRRWSQQAEKIFGWKASEVIGKNWKELRFVFEEDLARVKNEVAGLIDGSQTSHVCCNRNYRKDGLVVYCEWYNSALLDEQGNLASVLSLVQDVTEGKRTEQLLRSSEARFRRIFESNMIGIGFWDLEGKIADANNALLQLVGYSREELQKGEVRWIDMTPPEYSDLSERSLEEIKAHGVCTPFEMEYIRSDGSRVPIMMGASFLEGVEDKGVFFVLDISDRVRARSALQKSLKRLEKLHAIDTGILEAHSPEAIASIAIHHLQQMVPTQRTCVTTFDFKRGENQAPTAKILAIGNSSSTQERAGNPTEGYKLPLEVFGEIVENLREGKDYIVADISIFPASHPLGKVFGEKAAYTLYRFPLRTQNELIGMLEVWVSGESALNSEEIIIVREVADVVAIAIQQARLTEQISRYTTELEERVAVRTAQLQEINTELEAFSYSVSHDLRAPLRAVRGFADALVEDCGDRLDPLGQQYIQRIIKAASHMDTLIQDLLAYSRLSRAEVSLRPVSVGAVVAEVLTQLEVELNERNARVTVVDPMLELMGHRATLVTVVTNMLGNAIKFVDPLLQPSVRLWTEDRGEWVRLWVEDNGIGIFPEHQERIFRVFERLHGMETYPGTGIGLAVVRKGMERMGGRVGVESEFGSGSRFWIEAPSVAHEG